MSTATTTSESATARTTWQIDASHTLVEFAVKHMMIATVKGRFATVSGSVTTQGEDPKTAIVDVTIDAASIDTREDKRDAHLRSADFFNVEQFPTLTFKSKRVDAHADGALRVIGDLTIKDVTREVTLDAEFAGQGKDPWGGFRVGYSATTKIKRSDFGLTWNVALEAGGVLVGDEIKISLEVELVKQG
ncbi:MAG TPA: YceI family protein [Gemmatimonadaceae bacterium]|jgi:polyisoprenoid-binding protein YceI|nr:YceI family protein [Gemmatimonadaceae bacterium]